MVFAGSFRQWQVRGVAVFLSAWCALAPAWAVSIDSGSRRYYCDGAGQPVFLIGYYGWAAVPNGYFIDHPSEYATMITRGAPYGTNYIRMSLGVNRFTPTSNPPVYYGSPTPTPFLYVNGKADLSQWDAVFWNGLRAQCDLARQNGVIVHLSIFDGVELRSQGGAAYGYNNSFWNPANQTTVFYPAGDYSDTPGGFYRYNDFVGNTGIGHYQKLLIDKTLSESSDFDNVFYEVGNELIGSDPTWYGAVMAYIESRTSKPVSQCGGTRSSPTVLQGYSDHIGDTAAQVRDDIADFVTQAAGHYPTWIDPDGPALSDASVSADELRAAAWYSLTGGAAGWGGFTVDFWIGGRGFWPDTANAYKNLQAFLKQTQLNFTAMLPRHDLITVGGADSSCLANVGHEYAVYVRSAPTVTVDLTGLSGSMTYLLYDPRNDGWSEQQILTGGGPWAFSRPDGALDWVVYIGPGMPPECPAAPPSGILGDPQFLGDGIEPGMATDAQGFIHVVYVGNGSLIYRKADPSGVFGAPETIPSPPGSGSLNAPHVVCDGNGVPHVAFSNSFYPAPGNCWYTNRIGGFWKAPVSAFAGVIVMYPRLALCGSVAFVAASTANPGGSGTLARISNLAGVPHVDASTDLYLLAPYPVADCADGRLWVVGRNSGSGHYLQEYDFNTLASVGGGQKMSTGTPNKTTEPTAAFIDAGHVVHALGTCGATGIDPEANTEFWYNNTARMAAGQGSVIGLAGVSGSGWWGDNVYPHMVMDAGGTIWLAFRDVTTGEGKIATVSEAGFGPPTAFAAALTDPGTPVRRRWNCQLASAPGGGVYVSWDYDNKSYLRPVGTISTCDLAVSIDLGSPDAANCMTHPQGGDGDTLPATAGGRDCRRNLDKHSDYYFYFGICDGFAYQGSRPDLYISFEYFDSNGGDPPGAIWLQYDSSAGNDIPAIYKSAGGVAVGDSNQWKQATFHLPDAYLGNRQNGGADFRLGDVERSFYIDSVRVSVQLPLPPAIDAVTPDPDSVRVGGRYTRQLSSSQTCPPPVWSLVEGPPGMSVCATSGKVYGWTPEVADLGDHSITVQACVPAGCGATTWTVRVLSRKDFDADNDVDQDDFGVFQRCLSGSGFNYLPDCAAADLDLDGDVDGADLSLFRQCLTGPGGRPGC